MDAAMLLKTADVVAGTSASMMQNDKPQQNGSISANAGIMGCKTPFIRIKRNKGYNANNLNTLEGLPANSTVSLGSITGYTVVKDVIVKVKATQEECREIESLLKGGVIL